MPLALLLSACTQKEFGSNCTKEPITIEASQQQPSAASVIEPFLLYRHNGIVLTIGRYDALAILAERAKENEYTAKAVSLLRPKLEALPRSDNAVDVDDIRPKFDGLRGQELEDGVLITNELNVLFLRALVKGVAVIGGEGKSHDTLIQRYSANLKDGQLFGFRVLQGKSVIYDYCGIHPKRP
jgi:hypothetical protein